MSDWRPIETAPKDGRFIIVGRFEGAELYWVKHSRWMTEASLVDMYGGDECDWEPGWANGNDEEDEPCHPTHWMPLNSPTE